MKLKRDAMIFLLVVTMLLMPYGALGQEFSSVIICLISLLVFMKHKDEIAVDKGYMFLIMGLILTGLLSLIFTNNFTKTLSGLTVFVNAALMYMIFLQYKTHSMKIIKCIVYTLSIASIIFILYQCGIHKIRIDGNIGYANTYGLVLLIGLYLNEINENKKFSWLIQVSLMLGIIYTQSRNTLIYLIAYLIIKIIYDFKEKEKLSSITNFFISIFMYLLIQVLGFGMFFILPIILLTIEFGYNKISAKIKNILPIVLALIGIPVVFLSNINLSKRIANISLTTGVFQERLIYFEDVIRALGKNPFGFGIDSFEYSQYGYQTAFYDVKYVHNSILQIGYDMGIIGMMLFIALGIWGLIILSKSTNKFKKYYIPLYLTIYLHSLLDFDFSYVAIWGIVVMIIAFSQENFQKAFKLKYNIVLNSIGLIFSVYLILVNSCYMIGDKFNSSQKLDEARNLYMINKAVTFKDPDVYFRLAEIERKESDNNKNKEALNASLMNLKEAEKINPKDPRIVGNIAFVYQRLGDDKQAIEYYDKFLNKEKFYVKMYDVYYSFLSNKWNETHNGLYKDKMEWVEKAYYNNLKLLNPKAKYLEDQMGEGFNKE